MEVFCADEQLLEALDLSIWEQRLESALQLCGQPDCCQLSVVFVDDLRIADLNSAFRGKSCATDVLSFPQLAGTQEATDAKNNMPRLLGDIVVSVETASRQAHSFGHSLERELGFLLVHGLLHLLGEDHLTARQGRRMRRLQRKILEHWGLELDGD